MSIDCKNSIGYHGGGSYLLTPDTVEVRLLIKYKMKFLSKIYNNFIAEIAGQKKYHYDPLITPNY